MIARARWVSRESIVAILTHPGIGSGTTVLLAWAGPQRNHGCRDAHGEHQEPDQAEPPERAPAPTTPAIRSAPRRSGWARRPRRASCTRTRPPGARPA